VGAVSSFPISVLTADREQEVAHGTAWVVQDGLVCTAFHVVGHCATRQWRHEAIDGVVYLVGGLASGPQEFQTVVFDPKADLALLAGSTAGIGLPLAPRSAEGEEWRADAYPGSMNGAKLTLSGEVVRSCDEQLQLRFAQGTNVDWGGASGAAAVGSDGQVLGIITATASSIATGWATAVEALHRLLDLRELVQLARAALGRFAEAALAGVDRERLDEVLAEASATWADPRSIQALRDKLAGLAPSAEPPLLDQLAKACDAHLRRIMRYQSAVFSDDRFVHRDLEQEMHTFLRSDKSAMVVVGQSGMGKSTMVLNFLRGLAAQGHLGFFMASAGIPADCASHVREFLMDQLSQLSDGVLPPDNRGLVRLNHECGANGKVAILVIDAVNEFDRGAETLGPLLAFMASIDELAAYLRKEHLVSLKLIVTSRPEIWRRGVENPRVRSLNTSNAYFAAGERIEHELGQFSPAEAEQAYVKFTSGRNPPAKPYHELTALTRCQLRDPFLLTIAFEAYPDGLPEDLDREELYRLYRDRKTASIANPDGARGFLSNLTRAMFEGHIIRSDSVAIEELADRHRALWDAVDRGRDGRLRELLEANLIRVYRAGSGSTSQVRFAYDRFAQFLFAEKICEQIKKREEAGTENQLDAAFDIIKDNLPGAQRMTTVFGALRRVLLVLGKEMSPGGAGAPSQAYSDLLRRLATESEHGLSLAVSVLARAATLGAPEGQGLEPVRELLQRFCRDIDARRPRGQGGPIGFPIIDAVYRVLLDEEYRAWRQGQPAEIRQHHNETLYSFFDWGLRNRSREIAGSSVQYLFFLWAMPQAQADAAAILDRTVAHVNLRSVFRVPGQRALANAAWMICSVLAQGRDDPSVPRVLRSGKALIRQLHLHRPLLGRALAFLTGTRLQLEFLDHFETMHYPVNMKEARAVFAEPALRSQAQEAIALMRKPGAWSDADWLVAQRLSRCPNGFVLEFLSLSLSVTYDRLANEGERQAHLARLGGLLPPEGPIGGAHYAVALAYYHINYFSRHASRDSLAQMGSVAHVLLRDGKGEFRMNRETYTTAIIGTYGRALRRHADFLSGTHDISPEAPLSYALRALDEAKRTRDADYYASVSRDVGLLGVLIEPQQVFEVFESILRDLGIGRDGTQIEAFLPFDDARRAIIREVAIKSLANIRVVHRSEVDRYILDVLGNQVLFGEVIQCQPEFSLATIGSWISEQIIFVVLTDFAPQFGARLVDCFDAAMQQKSASAAARIFVRDIFRNIGDLCVAEG